MKRPYDIDEGGIVHRKDGECDYVSTGDSNLEGVTTGIIEDGYGLCNDCNTTEVMADIFRMCKRKLELLY